MIEAFCVKSEDLTNQELNIMLEKCVGLGATPCDWIDGVVNDEADDCDLYARNELSYWGVTAYSDTYTSNHTDDYVNNILSKEEAFELLGIETKVDKPVPRLEPFCINSSDVSEEDLLLILKRCKELGACIHEWVSTQETVEKGLTCSYKNSHIYWGLTFVHNVYSHNHKEVFDNNVLTKDEAFEMLGLTIKPTTKLGEPKDKTLPETLQEANCSLTIDNKEFIVFDKDTDLTYYLLDEDQVEYFVQELVGIKKFLRLD